MEPGGCRFPLTLITLWKATRELAQMSDNSPAILDIRVGGDQFTPSTQEISQLSQREPR